MKDKETVSRRQFLSFLAGVPLAGAALTPLAAAGQYLYPPASLSAPPKPMEAAAVDQLAVGTVKEFTYNDTPAALVRLSDKEFKAFYRKCTHLGCTAIWKPNEKIFYCPCHGGKFDLNGNNIGGPPPKPLQQLTVTIAGGKVMVAEGRAQA